jgi:hypothetical protein
MNPQRGCTGVNSYLRDLKLDPIAWITRRLETYESADDRMGANYTKQNTVGSYYDLTRR